MTPLESNFLVPNGTFFVELFAFLLILFILGNTFLGPSGFFLVVLLVFLLLLSPPGKYLPPPINTAMTARRAAIRKEFSALARARADAKWAGGESRAQIGAARHEAARIREE